MTRCPRCNAPLTAASTRFGVLHICRACSGRCVTVPVLRRATTPELLRELWPQVLRSSGGSQLWCPFCTKAMARVVTGEPPLTLDACVPCQLLWFDARELEQVVAQPIDVKPAPALEVPPEAAGPGERWTGRTSADTLASPWSLVRGAFGLPVEASGPAVARPPLVTWTVAAALTLVTLVALPDIDGMSRALGLVPDRPFRLGGLTWLTSFFLHGGWAHLLGNLYFLCTFGPAVEDRLGRWRYGLLLGLADLVGNVAHVALEPASALPCIGASGGISGVLVFYALRFPQARLAFLWRPFVVWFHWLTLPAWGALVLWVLLQGLGVAMQLRGMSDVSFLAHLGGAVVGLGMWLRAPVISAPPKA